MTEIVLALPVKIRPTVNNDGYIIIDADGTEYYFYRKKNNKASDNMIYDGRLSPLKLQPLRKKSSRKNLNNQ